MADILDLLSDNSSIPKPSTSKKGGFLNALKKNSLMDHDTNKPSYAFDRAVINVYKIFFFVKIKKSRLSSIDFIKKFSIFLQFL